MNTNVGVAVMISDILCNFVSNLLFKIASDYNNKLLDSYCEGVKKKSRDICSKIFPPLVLRLRFISCSFIFTRLRTKPEITCENLSKRQLLLRGNRKENI